MELDSSSATYGTPACQSGTETISSTPDTTRKRLEATTAMDKVLILDGNTRSALAVRRFLGSKCAQVVVADATTGVWRALPDSVAMQVRPATSKAF